MSRRPAFEKGGGPFADDEEIGPHRRPCFFPLFGNPLGFGFRVMNKFLKQRT